MVPTPVYEPGPAERATVPPTLADPELRAKALVFSEPSATLMPLLTSKFPEIDKVVMVEVRTDVVLTPPLGSTVPPTTTEPQLTVPDPVISAAVLLPVAFCSVMLVATFKGALPEFPLLTINVWLAALAASNVIELTEYGKP